MASVGFSILPVSNRDSAGRVDPHSGSHLGERKSLAFAYRFEPGYKIYNGGKTLPIDGVSAGRCRTGFTAWTRRTASSSARCSAVRTGFVVGFIALLLRLRDIVRRDRSDDQRIGQVQHLEYDGNESAGTGDAKCDGTTG